MQNTREQNRKHIKHVLDAFWLILNFSFLFFVIIREKKRLVHLVGVVNM